MLGGIDLGGTQVRVAVARSDCRIEAGLRTQTHNFKRPEEFVEWCARELGHTIVVPDGPLCGCGQHGCLEAVAAGSGIERTTGRPAVEVFQAAAQGDRQARAQVAGAARTMGVALVNLANLLDPDVIVIGGGLTKSWRLVLPDLVAPLKESPFVKPYRRPKVVRARLGQRVGLV